MDETRNVEIEALIAAFYAAFDNRAGRAPNGEALRAIFADTAIVTRVDRLQVETWSPDAFVAPRVAMLTDGTLTDFHEWEVAAQTIVRANTASRSSSYEKRGLLNGADYRGRGHKFIQLMRLDRRWRISSVLWEDA